MKSHNSRCINIDWLEVYALEPATEDPHDADFFRRVGLCVKERDYGTPVYHEMFTIMGNDDLPLLEVRRRPKSAIGEQPNGVLDPRATHIRLCNRTCYFDNASELMQKFLETYHYELKRISRLDIALDFEYFDSGDDPQKFLQRYINGKYSKVNQSRISVHGLDMWDGRYWNSVKWGSAKSMVNTKFYDKTLELREQHDKPYIRQAWYASGLVDDWRTLERVKEDGCRYTPKIWRVEFSIKSHEKNWFVIENPYGTKPKLRSIRHTLDRYYSRVQLCDVFFSLCLHYFAFKKVVYISDTGNEKDRKLQRKDRCPDKVLWDTRAVTEVYKLMNVNTNEPATKFEYRLITYLQRYQQSVIDPKIHRAIYQIIEHLETRAHRNDINGEIDDETRQAIKRLVNSRMTYHGQANELTQEQIEKVLAGELDIVF